MSTFTIAQELDSDQIAMLTKLIEAVGFTVLSSQTQETMPCTQEDPQDTHMSQAEYFAMLDKSMESGSKVLTPELKKQLFDDVI